MTSRSRASFRSGEGLFALSALAEKSRDHAGDRKIEHKIFALVFAFFGAFLAARGFPCPGQIRWILLAMAGARSAAMAFNRLAGLPFDTWNPRTAARALPRREVTPGIAVVFIVVTSIDLVLFKAT